MWRERLFLGIQSINFVYPNMENMIVVPITKIMEIVMSIHVHLISRMNFNYTESGVKKAFFANPKHQDRVSQYGEHNCSANNKNNEDYYEYPNLSLFTKEL